MYFWLAEHEWKGERAPNNQEMMKMLEEYQLTPYFWPGRRFEYSNTGYIVLAAIIEQVSGMSFNDFMAENIFKPLEMNHSYIYRFERDSIRPNQLIGYGRRGRRRFEIGGYLNDGIVGDKNVYSTAQDLFKWVKGLNSGLISEKSLQMMYTRGKTRHGREIPYGFGFRIVESDKGHLIYHNGKWNGFRTTVRQYRNENLIVIVLEQTNYGGIPNLVNKLRFIVNESYCF
jgi:CubicO group peptidase (beta-lactamase class C family)